jgi:hypothetical protein
MENLAVTISLPNLKLNIPEKEINFHILERIIFNLSRKIGQELYVIIKMRWSAEEHQKFINFFPKNIKKIPKKMLDSLGGDILKIKFWKN